MKINFYIRFQMLFFLFFLLFLLFLKFIFGCVGSSLLHAGFLLVVVSGACSSLLYAGFSLRWLLLLRNTGSRRMGCSSCDTWAQQLCLMGSRAQAHQLWHTGLVAPRHVGSSQTRARTRVPYIGRQILNHCATREAQMLFFLKCFKLLKLNDKLQIKVNEY